MHKVYYYKNGKEIVYMTFADPSSAHTFAGILNNLYSNGFFWE